MHAPGAACTRPGATSVVRGPWSRPWSRLRWAVLATPLLLLSLALVLMAVTLPPPLAPPPSGGDRRPARGLSSAEDFVRAGPGGAGPRDGPVLEGPAAPPRPRPSGGNGSEVEAWNRVQQPQGRREEVGCKEDGRQEGGDSTAPPDLLAPERRASGPPNRPAHRRTSSSTRDQQPAARRSNGHPDRRPSAPAGRTPRRRPPGGREPESRSAQRDAGSLCRSFGDQDFPDGDRRTVRASRGRRPPWLSADDVQKLELLAGGGVVSKASVAAHGQVLQVGLQPAAQPQTPAAGAGGVRAGPGVAQGEGGAADHGERCRAGLCCLVKRSSDWLEVLAFHLDRVLGLNRSLPAVLRTFHSPALPYRYTAGPPRPAVWWDPGLRHLADRDNDQNSVVLDWVRYQQLLQAHCGTQTHLDSAPCVGVRHAEWGRLALFDFLLQVSDRLDRYCCGFTPDPSELCVENQLHARCGHAHNLQLVHILVRQADPSRLVFIDNSGRPQSSNELNFRLIEGIDEFPEEAVSVLGSGCLETLLLRSLYVDRVFWESRGGSGGLRPLVHMVQQRGLVLLRHIQDKKLRLGRDP